LFFKTFCLIETPEDDYFLIETCSISEINKGLCLTEIILVQSYENVARIITGHF